jgi:hypothetical protein
MMGIYMNISDLIKHYDRIFIEASALLSHSGQFLLNEFSNYDITYYQGANHIIITNETAFILQQDPGVTKVNYLLKSLQKLQGDKIVQFKFFDNKPYSVIFDKFLHRYSLALITNDRLIASEVIDYPYQNKNKPFGVYAINNKIQLESYIKTPFSSIIEKESNIINVESPVKNLSREKNEDINISQSIRSNIVESPLFSNKVIDSMNSESTMPFSKEFILNPKHFKGIDKYDFKLNHQIPTVNDILTSTTSQSVHLTSLLSNKGGEGTIYYTNIKGYVCKIYKADTLTAHKEEKLKLIVSKPLDDPRIAYPKELVYFKGKFVGYIMPFVKGDFIGDFFLGLLSVNRFKNWTRLDLIELGISILQLVKKTHSHGILIGDVNRNNFMIETPKRVYMVDVDSAQVEKYPCPVGVEEFTPPEIIDGEHSYREFFRTYDNEYYSIAVLMFMLLTLGAQTTTQIVQKSDGSLSKIEKIKRQNFGFTLNEHETKSKQNLVNYALWSRFPSYIKDAFYNTFHKLGKYNHPKKRLDINQWIELLKSYKYHLSSGLLGNGSSEFNNLITKEPVSFSSVVLEPSRFIDFKTNAFTLEKLIQSLTTKLKDLNYQNISEILETLIKEGKVDSNYLKIQISSNFGFMYKLDGLLYVNGGN